MKESWPTRVSGSIALMIRPLLSASQTTIMIRVLRGGTITFSPAPSIGNSDTYHDGPSEDSLRTTQANDLPSGDQSPERISGFRSAIEGMMYSFLASLSVTTIWRLWVEVMRPYARCCPSF